MSSSKPPLDDLRIDRPANGLTRSWTGAWVVAGLVVVVLVVLFLWRSRGVGIDVHTAVAQALAGATGAGSRTVLNASGYVTARRAATVSSKVTGKVVEVLIEEGMHGEEGQVVARLDDTNASASLAVALAQLDSARTAVDETRAQLAQAERDYERTQELARQKIASASDLDRAEAQAKMLRARLARQESDVAVAERQAAQWRQQLEDLTIRAPFAGVVTTKDAQPGEMISPVSAGGGFTRTGIGTIVDMSSLEIEIDVNESYINRVQPGQAVEATLDAYPDWKIPCHVIAIIPTADRQKSTVKVRVGFEALDPRILPEMSVKVAFHDTGEGTVLKGVWIPREALASADGHDVVYVVEGGRAERRAVTVSTVEQDRAVVLAGLNAGEKVVVKPPAELANGAAVREIATP